MPGIEPKAKGIAAAHVMRARDGYFVRAEGSEFWVFVPAAEVTEVAVGGEVVFQMTRRTVKRLGLEITNAT